jgi:hypothetical protein
LKELKVPVCEVSEHELVNVEAGVYTCNKCGFTIDIAAAHDRAVDDPNYNPEVNKITWEALIQSAIPEND